jgi:hypothetical protein
MLETNPIKKACHLTKTSGQGWRLIAILKSSCTLRSVFLGKKKDFLVGGFIISCPLKTPLSGCATPKGPAWAIPLLLSIDFEMGS